MNSDLKELGTLRLERGWTYLELAQAVGLCYATVRRLLTVRQPRMYETTAYIIHKFLDAQRATDAAQAAPKRKRLRRALSADSAGSV